MDNITNIYSKKKDKNITYEKSLDSKNRTVHYYTMKISITRHFRITEPTIRKLCFLLGLILGALICSLYNCNKPEFLKFSKDAKDFIFYCTPFARDILKNNNFRYIFIISTILTIIVSLITFCVLYSEFKKIILSFITLLIFSFVYLYINFGICHLLIKIPKYFKFLSFIAIVLINIVLAFIFIGVECAIIATLINEKKKETK